MGSNVDISIRAQDQASATLNSIAGSLRTLEVVAGASGPGISRADVAWGAFAGTLSANVAMALATATSALVGFAQNSIMTAARVQELEAVTAMLGKKAGLSASEIASSTLAIKDLGITSEVANNLLGQFIRYELSAADAVKLARVAQDAAVLSGQDSSQTLGQLLHGILTYQPEVIRMAGLNVNLEQTFIDLAKSTGVARSELSQTDRVQATLNAVFAEGARVAGAYETAMLEPGKQLRSLMGRELPTLAEEFGRSFLEAFGTTVMAARELVKELIVAVKEGGSMHAMLDQLGEAATTAVKAVIELGTAVKGGLQWMSENKAMLEAIGKALVALKVIDTVVGAFTILQGAMGASNVAGNLFRALLPNIAAQMGTATVATNVQTTALRNQVIAMGELGAVARSTTFTSMGGQQFALTGKPSVSAPTTPTTGGMAVVSAGGGVLAALSQLAMVAVLAATALEALKVAASTWEWVGEQEKGAKTAIEDAMRKQAIDIASMLEGVAKDEMAARYEYNKKLWDANKNIPVMNVGAAAGVTKELQDVAKRISEVKMDAFVQGLKDSRTAEGMAQSALNTVTWQVTGGFEGLVGILPDVIAAFSNVEGRWRAYELAIPFGDAGARYLAAGPSDYQRLAGQGQELTWAANYKAQIAAAGGGIGVIPSGMSEGMYKAMQSSADRLLEIKTVQDWLKANPGDKVQQEYLKSLLGATDKLTATLEGSLAAAFPSLGAAQGWMAAFAEQHGGRAPGAVDVRDQQASVLFQQKYGRGPTEEEWQKRYYTGSFEGIDESTLDAIYGKPGTWKVLLEGQAETTSKQTAAIEAAFVALGKGTLTTSFVKAQEVIVTNFPIGGGSGGVETWSDDPSDSGYEISNLGHRRPKPMAYGDFFSRATNVIVGEAGPEVILPLSKPDRARQLLTQAIQYAPSIAMGLPMPMAEGGITTAIPIGQKAIATDKSVLQSIRDTATKTIERIIGKDTTIKDNRFVERLVRDVTPTLIAQVAIPHLAQGDFFNQAVNVIVGENGPEVIIPLSKPERAGQLLQQSISISPSFERVMMAVMAAKMQPVIPRMAEGGIIQALPIPRMAKGGIVRNPMFAWLAQQERQKMTNMGLQVTAQGEAGPEVILPLSKPERASQLLGQAIQYAPRIAESITPRMTPLARMGGTGVDVTPRMTPLARMGGMGVDVTPRMTPLARMGGMGVDVTPRMLPLARMGGMGVDVTPRMTPLASQIAMTPPPRMGQSGASYLPLRPTLSAPGFPVAQSRIVGLPMPTAQGGMMGGPMPLRLSAPAPVSVTIAGGTFLGTEAEAQAFARKIKKYLDREGARTL